MAPLGKVGKRRKELTITVGRTIVIATESKLVVNFYLQPISRLDHGLHSEVTPLCIGVILDSGALGIGEGNTGVVILTSGGESDVGSIGPAGAEHVGRIEP